MNTKLPKHTDKLLTRDQFREGVFKRDEHKCVVCKEPGQDAHHILERRLFVDGGYYLSNGATLCGKCHIRAEQTAISVEAIREACGILAPALPEHFYPDERYTKWGDIILGNGMRCKGELFHDESVQKILKEVGMLDAYTSYVKYPRTLHVPWSPGATSDDKIHKNMDQFKGERVLYTKKMDGECTTMYTDNFHARSLDSASRPDQSFARNLWSKIKHDIPEGYRICCENLYVKHSIFYNDLDSYLPVYSIWDNNKCLSWHDTVIFCELLGLRTVPVIENGLYDEQFARNLASSLDSNNDEGYVIRVQRAFQFSEFKSVVAKYVRAGHVQTTHHWLSQRKEINKLK